MNLFESVKKCLFSDFCNFNGRATRSEFWYFTLFSYFALFLSAFVVYILPENVAIFVLAGMILFLAIPSLAVACRRLHDINKSGWWILIANIIPFAIFYVLYLLIKKSDEGPNKYGFPEDF